MGKTDKRNENSGKFYGMRNDYMFRAVLQESEVVLRNLLSALLEMEENEIVSCRIENPIELGKTIEDKFCIRVLDLTQIEKAGDANPRLLKWARIFLAKTMEELEQLAGREEALQEMVLELKKLSEEEKIRMACEAREDYERRMLTQYRAGERAGREEGIEEGMRKGKAEGKAEGIAQGITKGQEETLKVLNWLQENGRQDDLQKVLQDKEYLEKVLGEYNALGNQKQLN